ncbi:MAG TPA: NrsF family protein [Polyangiaceae bacterium]|jgi:hypothetical protein
MTTLPPDIRAAVLAQAKRAPSPDAAKTRRAYATVVVLGVLVALACFAPFGLKLGGRPPAFIAISAAGWAAIALGATLLASSKRKTMLGVARSVLAFVALAAGPAIVAWVMGCTMGWPDVRDAAGTLHQHVTCFLTTSLFALGPAVALAFVRRGSDPVHPRATGAALGAAAAAWGGVLIDLHCPLASAPHVAIGHVLPVAIYAALGALVGARLFGVRGSAEK